MKETRLFEAVTRDEWTAVRTGKHLDIIQALRHLKSGTDKFVRISCKVNQDQKLHAIHVYANRLGMKVNCVALKTEGWIYIAFRPKGERRGGVANLRRLIEAKESS